MNTMGDSKYIQTTYSGTLSFETLIKRLRQAVEYAKYKAWENEAGDKKAQMIVNSFHSGEYGSKNGIWVQVNESIEALENLCNQSNTNDNQKSKTKMKGPYIVTTVTKDAEPIAGAVIHQTLIKAVHHFNQGCAFYEIKDWKEIGENSVQAENEFATITLIPISQPE